MAVERIYSFLVPPLLGSEDFHRIKGTEVPLRGKLFDLQNEIYLQAPEACKIAISFVSTGEDDQQHNEVRDELISFTTTPNDQTAFPLAQRLASVTTRRSSLGLFFLVTGREAGVSRTVVARFPADSGILADDSGGDLSIEFLERVFMKNANSFKAAVYEAEHPQHRFWQGRAIDRQVNANDTEIRAYWVREFLQSEYLTNSAQGTRKVGAAFREAIRITEDQEVIDEILAAVRLARNLGGVTMTGSELLDRFGLSEKTKVTVRGTLSDPNILNDSFVFDVTEFVTQVPYQTVRLDNGASMTAPSEKFDEIVVKEHLDESGGGFVRLTTTGKIVSQRLGRKGAQ